MPEFPFFERRQMAAALVTLAVACAGSAMAQANLPIYTDNLVNAFQDWSWGTHDLGNSSPVHSGSNSISASFVAWQGLSFHNSDFNTTPYSSVSFWANGGSGGGQIINVYAELDGTNALPVFTLPALPAINWQQFTVPLSALGVDNQSNLVRLTFQLTSFGTTSMFYLDRKSVV